MSRPKAQFQIESIVNLFKNLFRKKKLNIEFNTNSDNHHSKLLNMMGQIILESDSNEINTSAVPNGIYILKMDALPNYSKKIIVKH
jgi:hypothetical protein